MDETPTVNEVTRDCEGCRQSFVYVPVGTRPRQFCDDCRIKRAKWANQRRSRDTYSERIKVTPEEREGGVSRLNGVVVRSTEIVALMLDVTPQRVGQLERMCFYKLRQNLALRAVWREHTEGESGAVMPKRSGTGELCFDQQIARWWKFVVWLRENDCHEEADELTEVIREFHAVWQRELENAERVATDETQMKHG